MRRIALLLLFAFLPAPAGAGQLTALPEWFVLRLKKETALQLFREYLKKPERVPGQCKFGGGERVVGMEAGPERTVAEIEYRLICVGPILTPDRFDDRRSPARRREAQIFRTPEFNHTKLMREKFIYRWTGDSWRLTGREKKADPPHPLPPPPPPEAGPEGDGAGGPICPPGATAGIMLDRGFTCRQPISAIAIQAKEDLHA